MHVSTTEILARRTLQHACGAECVEWALGLLERGVDSRAVRILAGITPPHNHFEVAGLRDDILRQLPTAETEIEDPITEWVREQVATALSARKPLLDIFRQVSQLAIDLDYPRTLQPFYLLFNAWEDLQEQGIQWYWEGADASNIEIIMAQEAESFLRAEGV